MSKHTDRQVILSTLQKRISHWRRAYSGKESIPEEFLDAAIDLIESGQYSLNYICRKLHLSNTTLKKRLGSTESAICKPEPSSSSQFLELGLEQFFQQPQSTPIPCQVEIESPDGTRLKIQSALPGSLDLMELSRSLLRRQP